MTNIITISREFGSGGHEIGEHVAQQLGWKFYDRHIVEQVAKESGLSEKFIEESGEYATSRSSLLFNLSIAGAAMGSGSLSLYDEIYVEQCKLIKKLAAESPCVIVGRCADYVLRERQDCMDIFIWADVKARIERISGQVKEGKSPEKMLKERDNRRRVYYRNYTGQEWGKVQNYQLALCSSALGLETCAELIVQLVKQQNG